MVGGIPKAPTCHSREETQKSRIDGYLVNLGALGTIHDYEVEKHEMIPTHSITRLELSRNTLKEDRILLNKLGSLKKAVEGKIQELTDEYDAKDKRQRRTEEIEKLKGAMDE